MSYDPAVNIRDSGHGWYLAEFEVPGFGSMTIVRESRDEALADAEKKRIEYMAAWLEFSKAVVA